MHHDPTIWKQLWDNAIGGAAVVTLLLGVWISARAVGLLNRPNHWLRSTYIPPRDLVGFFAMPHFMLEYENRGNVPVVFSDFMLMLPRIEGIVGGDSRLILHPGAELFIDKRPTTRVGGYQLLRRLDYRTNKVRLEPGEMHTDYFDLGAFFTDVELGHSLWTQVNIPNDFHPILSFHDNFGNNYYCDEHGIHRGTWEHPHLDVLRASAATLGFGDGVETRRRWWRWFGWKERRTPGLGEAPELALPDSSAGG
jgi:hypothetical protein